MTKKAFEYPKIYLTAMYKYDVLSTHDRYLLVDKGDVFRCDEVFFAKGTAQRQTELSYQQIKWGDMNPNSQIQLQYHLPRSGRL